MNPKTSTAAPGLTRRSLLGSTASLAGATAPIAAAQSAFPAGVFAETAGPEVTQVVLGFIALTDAAPLNLLQSSRRVWNLVLRCVLRRGATR